jgi:hypothetical protein
LLIFQQFGAEKLQTVGMVEKNTVSKDSLWIEATEEYLDKRFYSTICTIRRKRDELKD